MTQRSYAVIGSGALGGLYGGMLAKAGFDVHFLFHSDYDHVLQHGLKVESVWGDFHLRDVSAHVTPDTMPPCDVTLIGLKTTNNHLLKDLLPAPTRGGGVVLVLQNGLGIESDAAAVLGGVANSENETASTPAEGALRVLSGCCFLCSNKIGPGHLRHLDQGQIVFGDWQQTDDASRPKSISAIARGIESDLNAAGIDAKTTDDVLLTRWRKLLWNIPFNGLSVVLNASSKELIDHPSTERLARQTMVEIQAGAHACGVSIPDAMIEKTIQVTKEMVPYDSSMRLDYLNGRPMEIEALFRSPLRRAAQAVAEQAVSGGCIMPTVAAIEQQLSFLEATL